MDVYDNVIGGKLKFKNKDVKYDWMDLNFDPNLKSRRRSRLEDMPSDIGSKMIDKVKITKINGPDAAMLHLESILQNEDNLENDVSKRPTIVQINKTSAELAFEKQRRAQQEAEIEKVASKSYRKRIEEYNQALASLSEHHDIPKVGPG